MAEIAKITSFPPAVGQIDGHNGGRAHYALEENTRRYGKLVLQQLRDQPDRSLQDSLFDWLLGAVTQDERLKTELFRFVDALPALHSNHAIAGHLAEYMTQPNLALPAALRRIVKIIERNSATAFVAAQTASVGTRLMARHFIAATDARSATAQLRRLRKRNLGFSLDILGEAVISEDEAAGYAAVYERLIADLGRASDDWPANKLLDEASFGKVPPVNLSIKLTALYSRFDPMADSATVNAVKKRLRPLLRHARQSGVFINFDMEQNDVGPLTRQIFQEILMEDEFRDWSDVGIVIQAYLLSARSDLADLANWAHSRGTPVWVRLVKGAYWDYETITAEQRGYPCPVLQHKASTDANYEQLIEDLLPQWQTLRPAIATHNIRSAAHALATADKFGLPPSTLEFQVLFGMGEALGRALAAISQRVRVYVPCGELLPGMAYLVRRLLENSANESFVRRLDYDHLDDDKLLEPPAAMAAAPRSDALRTASDQSVGPQSIEFESNLPFRNEPITNFALESSRLQMQTALSTVAGQLGHLVPVIINGAHEISPTLKYRPDPGNTDTIVSRTYWATADQAERALAAAHAAQRGWADTPAAERAQILFRLADYFKKHRFEIAAWQVYEAGKPWRDADSDVAEAIDFCNYYASEMLRLSLVRQRDVAGERNEYFYDARGPAVIIAPWNFPLAILTGMTSAALVTGNTVIIKPAEQASRIALFLMEGLAAAGAPPGIAQFLPGSGEELGPVLVEDSRVALVAFTGSRQVGLQILRQTSEVQLGQHEIKRVIAELGGKNAIIIDEDADLDEAIAGTLASMTGYAGQKCSACSRVIIVGAAYEPFCRRLKSAVASIAIGPAQDPAYSVGPLIDADAQVRIHKYLDIGRAEGTLLVQNDISPQLAETGYYVPVAVFTGCSPQGQLWRDEIFGPVLAILHATNLDEALVLASHPTYALTGGFYSRSPHNIERIRREFRVGNLYINRRITGALVDRQPFGGLGQSGVGSKAGGPDYLLQFLVPRTVTESVMRHGFAPASQGAAEGAN